MNCPSCQTGNPTGSRFCQNCGATLMVVPGDSRTVLLQTAHATPGPPSPSPLQMQTARSPMPSIAAPSVTARFPPINDAAVPQSEQREHVFTVHDVSDSINWPYDSKLTKLQASKRASGSMVINKGRIDPKDELGLIAFNSEAWLVLPLSPIGTHKQKILEAIQSLSAEGGTDINRGLVLARESFDWSRNDVVRRIILLTDGQGGDPLRTATDLKERGVVIDVVGVGPDPSNVDERLLRAVASVIEGESRYRFIKDSQTLVQHYIDLAHKTATA